MDRGGEWIEVSVKVSPESVEAVSEVLARYGHQGGVVIEEAQRPADDGVSLERDPTGPAVVRTYIPRDGQAADRLQQVRATLDTLDDLGLVEPLQVAVLQEQDWASAWREYYPILRVGERIVVVPAWQRFQPAEDDVVLVLDPGMAFGTGLHATTQLCLRALERHIRPGMRVLDLGTGSGILAIAAARLGGGSVLALDTDPLAVQAAYENVQRNRLTARVEVERGTLSEDWGRFDLILANLLARTLQEMADLLARSLTAEGVLIASGVLAVQLAEVTAAMAAAGLCSVERLQQDEWVALVAQHP